MAADVSSLVRVMRLCKEEGERDLIMRDLLDGTVLRSEAEVDLEMQAPSGWESLDLLSSCCLGGLAKSQLIPDRTLKTPRKTNIGKLSHRRRRRQWSSSPETMENSVSISHSLETHLSSAPATVSEENKIAEDNVNSSTFNNQAWNEIRREWVGDQSKRAHRVTREPIISWCTTYEDLLSHSHPFPQPIPLSEMVDFLVDIWHEEGLYD